MVTVSPLEFIWTTVAVLGLFYSIPALKDARDDLLVLRRRKINSHRMLMAKANVRNELTRAVQLSIWAIIGLGASLIPPNPNSSIIGNLFGVAFVLVELMIVYGTYKDRLVRRIIVRDAMANLEKK